MSPPTSVTCALNGINSAFHCNAPPAQVIWSTAVIQDAFKAGNLTVNAVPTTCSLPTINEDIKWQYFQGYAQPSLYEQPDTPPALYVGGWWDGDSYLLCAAMPPPSYQACACGERDHF